MDVFFFSSRRRHTRYWRDWSSDVCSSDLNCNDRLLAVPHRCTREKTRCAKASQIRNDHAIARHSQQVRDVDKAVDVIRPARSEERRVGKECRYRRSTEKEKKNNRTREVRQ